MVQSVCTAPVVVELGGVGLNGRQRCQSQVLYSNQSPSGIVAVFHALAIGVWGVYVIVMIASFSMLLICQLAGEVLARSTGLPVPGPVLGMGLMFSVLIWRDRLSALLPREVADGTLEAISATLLANLALLFVPAGVGVVQRLDVLGQHAVGLGVALVVSSVLGMLATAFVFRALAGRS